MNDRMDEQESESRQGPTIRDRRRIDPETFQVREPQATAAPEPAGSGADAAPSTNTNQNEVDELNTALAERTADLQRLQAEYVNYKRRVDRDRDVARKVSIENVMKELLPVLDDVRSARDHGELTGGFKAVADELERIGGKYGLEAFGTKGDVFNPHVHEALLHAHAEGIDGPTCVEILQPGYRIGERILRPARVAVAEPAEAESTGPAEGPGVEEGSAPVDGSSAEPVAGQERVEGSNPADQ